MVVVICFQSIIFDILKTTWSWNSLSGFTVVICFQSIIFDILKTTRVRSSSPGHLLWFAFNLLSLTYWKQPSVIKYRLVSRCDLLSIYYLWHTENNTLKFKNQRYMLWFAFNLLSLTYWKQLVKIFISWQFCCDLLSIYYLWHTENNTQIKMPMINKVVICFQSIIFDILKTTKNTKCTSGFWLWFAFNLLSLTYWKQQLA